MPDPGGASEFAFFTDTTLGMTPEFQYAFYDTTQQTVLPAIASRIGGASGTLAPCSGTTASAQTTCAQTFIQAFAKKAYRRPVDATEVANLMKVYAQGAMQDYATGISLMIQAVLISPSFVYRTELGPTTLTADASGTYPDTTLTPHEIATQLGFLFLGSVPDDQLMAAADNGSLATADGLSAQIDRLLASPQVQANLTSIMIDWFNVRQMFSKTKDTSLFSALATADQDQTTLENDIYTSTQKFVNEVFWTNPSGTVDDLVTSPSVWVNKRLATLFPGLSFPNGAPTSNTAFVKATWSASEGRAGMLTQPGFLWAASDPAVTSIVKRGKFIHDDILCQDAISMAIDLSTPFAMNVIHCKSPDGTKTLSACDSEVLESDARMSTQPCTSCHSQMDAYCARPPQLWTHRQLSNAWTRAVTRSIPPSRSCRIRRSRPAWPPAPRRSRRQLVQSGVLRGCSVQKVASYAIGDMIRTYDTCELDDLRAQTNGSDRLAVQERGDGSISPRAHGRYQVTSYKLKRRAFLQACGGSAALFAPLLRSIEARAQGVKAPLRLLILHHPLGAAPGLASWRPNASATTTNFTLPFESAPFEAAGLKPYMNMIDGLNVVFATRNSNANSGQNTHEGGIAVMMTGVPVLGRIGQQDHAAGGASIDQLLLDNSPLLGGPTLMDKTPFGSLPAGGGRALRPRRGVAAYALVPAAARRAKRRLQGTAADGAGHAADQRLPAHLRRCCGADGNRPGQDPGPEEVGARLHARRPGPDADARSREREGSAGGACHRDHPAREQPAADVRVDVGRQRRCVHQAGHAAQLLRGERARRTPTAFRRASPASTTTSRTCRTATRTWTSGSRSSASSRRRLPATTFGWRRSCGRRARTGSFSPGPSRGPRLAGNLQSTPHHPPSHSGDAATNNWLNQINAFYSARPLPRCKSSSISPTSTAAS